MQHIMWGEIGLSTLPGSYKDTSVTGAHLLGFQRRLGVRLTLSQVSALSKGVLHSRQ